MTMADLFQRIEDRRDEWNVEVMVAFLEIYNEEIRDLLTNARGIAVLENFKGYSTFTRRVSSGPASLQHATAAKAATTSRRSSSYGSKPSTANTSTSAVSPRRTYRTPRKSLRSSMQPYKRVVSDKDKRSAGKNVQWRDEAGQGDLDAVSVFPADVSSSWSSSNDAPAASAPQRSMSLGGSESE
jgi:kinesin family protein 18/19